MSGYKKQEIPKDTRSLQALSKAPPVTQAQFDAKMKERRMLRAAIQNIADMKNDRDNEDLFGDSRTADKNQTVYTSTVHRQFKPR